MSMLELCHLHALRSCRTNYSRSLPTLEQRFAKMSRRDAPRWILSYLPTFYSHLILHPTIHSHLQTTLLSQPIPSKSICILSNPTKPPDHFSSQKNRMHSVLSSYRSTNRKVYKA